MLSKENAKNGGIAAKLKKAGFHDPTKNGYNFVKGTKWWYNKKLKKHKRCIETPGIDWEEGFNKKCK